MCLHCCDNCQGDVMSNLPLPIQAIAKAEKNFKSIAKDRNTQLIWEVEAGYARQIINEKDLTYKTAMSNPNSLRDAIINISAVGLSLNKALAYAYLVPRDNQICLDISYKGLVKLATDSGSIKWAKAELVYSNDNFKYNGVHELPIIECDPFGDRGEIVGVYCIAKTSDNDYLVDTMSLKEVNDVKNISKAKNSKYSWSGAFFGEMAKKTIIKRASKSWPKTDKNHLQEAIHIINEHEGLEEKEYATPQIKDKFEHLFAGNHSLEMWIFQQSSVTNDQWGELCKSFPTEKTKCKKQLDEMISQGRAIFQDVYDEWIDCINRGDELGQKELEEQINPHGLEMLKTRKTALQQ